MTRSTKAWIVCTAGCLVVAGILTIGAETVAQSLAPSLDPLLAPLRGKVAERGAFLNARIKEAGLLLAALGSGSLIYGTVLHWAQRFGPLVRWVPLSVALWALLNLFVRLCSDTGVFWMAMWQGESTSNWAQFNVKRILMQDVARPQMVLLGSSQTRAQLDEDRINRALGERLWTTELHFPGQRAYDVFLTLDNVRASGVRAAVYYLSESSLFTGSDSEAIPYLFGLSEWNRCRRMGLLPPGWSRGQSYGVLGSIVPEFKLRDVLSARLLGPKIARIGQFEHQAALEADLSARARIASVDYRADASSEFQRRALREIVKQCQRRKITLILIAGQVHPALEAAFPPTIHQDFHTLIAELAGEPGVVVLARHQQPVQRVEDYSDLTHVTTAAQQRFTEFFIDFIGGLEIPGLRN